MLKRSIFHLLSVALVLYCGVQVTESAPIQYNPYTPVGDVVALDRNHPALGTQLPSTSAAFRPMVRMLPDSLADLLVTAAASGNASSTTTPTSLDRANVESFGAGVVIAANYDDAAMQRQLEGGGVTNEDLTRLETHFGAPLEYLFSALPRRGAIDPIPWPSSYWPVFQDSINYKWDKKQASPAEKYAKAFKHDVKRFMTRVSEVNGVASQRMVGFG